MQADGKIIIGGLFTMVGGVPRNAIARLENDAATQNLTVPSVSRVQWLRGGASPEAQDVAFELSTDGGATWTEIGTGKRIAGGWELTGQNLPTSGQVRARARVTCGISNGSSSLVESMAPYSLPLNAAPIVANPIADFSVNEDAANTLINLTTVFTDVETPPASLTYSVLGNSNATLVTPTVTASTNLMLAYTPNLFGTAEITVRASDAGRLFAEETFVVTVNAVNDAPVVMVPSNVVVEEDSGARSLPGFVTFSPGPANESGQGLVGYTVSNDHSSLFSVQPAVDSAGALTFTVAANANGGATITMIAQDDGGTDSGGADRSTNAFTITVTPVNDAPNVAFATNHVVVLANSGTKTLNGFAVFSAGPVNESGQSLISYTLSNANPALFTTPPTLDKAGTLTFTLATNAYGVATVTVVVQDDGGSANGGADKSTNAFTVTALSRPLLTGMTWLANGAFQFGFTNLSGVPFTAVASTTLTLPSINWSVLGLATEISPGQFQFIDLAATNFPYRFYQIRSP